MTQRVILQQAQVHGQSVSREIVELLTHDLMPLPTELAQLAAWEAASDEDWLNLEATLASVDVVVAAPRVEN